MFYGEDSKMKRIDRVYRELENTWSKDKLDESTEEHGSTAEEISKILGITRANTSSDLNQLVRLKNISLVQLRLETLLKKLLVIKTVFLNRFLKLKRHYIIPQMDCI